MTSRTTSRIAGVAFIAYIAMGLTGMALFSRATAGADMSARLASVPEHLTALRVSFLLTLGSATCAILLAATLHSLTRAADRELATLGMLCRAGEGILGIYAFSDLGLLWLATTAGAPSGETAATIATVLLRAGQWKASTCALLFAGGSTAFAFAFLRGRTLPNPLAVLGVGASLLLLATLPLQMAGWIGGTAWYMVMWMPMLVFELWLAGWLIVRGGASPPAPARV